MILSFVNNENLFSKPSCMYVNDTTYLDLLIVKSCFWWVMWPLGCLVHYYKDNNNLNECFFKFAVKPASISQIYAENISRTCLTVRWENSHPTKYQVYDIFSSDEWNFQNMSVSTCKLWLFEIFLAFFFIEKTIMITIVSKVVMTHLFI